MERVGLVAYVEEQLEREISLGRLPESGQLGSEQKLARRYGVCRGTVREALRRLAARGLVVQHPGRMARVVALNEPLTLENLGLALHEELSPEGRWLLEGYFCLKRQVLVDLLADCCERASQAALGKLEEACFRLWDAARWESGARCAQLEFDLLRLAAQAAARPGHLLLIQSLQRALHGGAARLLSFMGGEPLRQWAGCAMEALRERDTRALQLQVLALLRTCDERVLDNFAPEAHRAQECPLGDPASAPQQEEALEARPCVEVPGAAPRPPAQPLPVEPDCEALRFQVAPVLNPGDLGGECARGDVPGAALGNLSDCRTGRDALAPEGGLQSAPPPTIACGPTCVEVRKEEGGPVDSPDCPRPKTTCVVSSDSPSPQPSSMNPGTPSQRGSACVSGPQTHPLEPRFRGEVSTSLWRPAQAWTSSMGLPSGTCFMATEFMQ